MVRSGVWRCGVWLASLGWVLASSSIIVAAESSPSQPAPSQPAPSQPNVLVFLVDDLGVNDITIEGSTYYRTPNIDGLARGGMRFTAGYANCQVCSPSRASIQLGQFPARHGITDYIGAKTGMAFNRGDSLLPATYKTELPADEQTIAESLRDAGYRTFFAGKWHLGGEGSFPTDHGYEINVGGFAAGSPPGGFFAPFKNPKMDAGSPGESLTLRLAKETSDFIAQQSSADAPPFYAMLSFYAVHAPVQTTESLWRKYRDAAPPPPASGERFLIDRTKPVRQVQDHPVYAGMMETLDTAVGNVLKTLEESGQADSTIVIFTGDNGGVSSGDAYATCNLPLRGGKGRQWEGGIREPYYVRFPRVTKPGSTCDLPVTGADIFPTVLELCGLPLLPENHRDGRSLAKVLAGQSDPALVDRPLVWHYPHYGNQGGEPSSILRVGDYKLIHYYADGRDELYHTPSDIGEQHDLATEQPDRVASMRKQLRTYLGSVPAQYPTPDPRFDAAKYQQQLAKSQKQTKANLEREHAKMLEPDWQPNANWWGSTTD